MGPSIPTSPAPAVAVSAAPMLRRKRLLEVVLLRELPLSISSTSLRTCGSLGIVNRHVVPPNLDVYVDSGSIYGRGRMLVLSDHSAALRDRTLGHERCQGPSSTSRGEGADAFTGEGFCFRRQRPPASPDKLLTPFEERSYVVGYRRCSRGHESRLELASSSM